MLEAEDAAVEPITLTYDVPVPRPAAFYLFVRELGSWWPALHSSDPPRYESAELDARVGGALTFCTGGGETVWGEIVTIEPPALVSWRCWLRGDRRNPTLVTVRFTDSEWGARVNFEQSGWNEQNAGSRARYGDWPLILAEYVAHTRRHARGQGGSSPRALR